LHRDETYERESGRTNFSESLDPKRALVHKFVKQQLKIYSDSHDMELIAAASDSWEIAKTTNKLEIPFSIDNIADCAVFCKEMEVLLECSRVILEFDKKEHILVLKIPYNDLLRSIERLNALRWINFRRVTLMGRKALVFLGLCTLLYILYHLFFSTPYNGEAIHKHY